MLAAQNSAATAAPASAVVVKNGAVLTPSSPIVATLAKLAKAPSIEALSVAVSTELRCWR